MWMPISCKGSHERSIYQGPVDVGALQWMEKTLSVDWMGGESSGL
jgi:hypothetical protein